MIIVSCYDVCIHIRTYVYFIYFPRIHMAEDPESLKAWRRDSERCIATSCSMALMWLAHFVHWTLFSG